MSTIGKNSTGLKEPEKSPPAIQMGFRFIVISNQAGIARMTSLEEVKRIHRKMVETLAAEGIEILQVYVCPHHWEDNCDCQTQTSILFQASKITCFAWIIPCLLAMIQGIWKLQNRRDRCTVGRFCKIYGLAYFGK